LIRVAIMPPSTADARPDAAPIDRYAYKPSLVGATFEMNLGPDALQWEAGRRSGRIGYAEISRVRLSFRPVTMQTYRFQMEIWSSCAPKLVVASTSWKNLLEQERHDEAYAAFVRELHRRLARTGATTQYQAGAVALLYWPGVAIFVGTSLVLAGLVVSALQTATWSAAAIVAGFLALFLWQAGGFFLRNRPATYQPTAIPPQVLPRA
jgi:hypothetical protein